MEDKVKNWEIEFDKRFTDNPVFWAELNSEWHQGDVDVKPFKAFIRELLAKERERILQAVRLEKQIPPSKTYLPGENAWCHGYNFAIDELEKKLDKVRMS